MNSLCLYIFVVSFLSYKTFSIQQIAADLNGHFTSFFIHSLLLTRSRRHCNSCFPPIGGCAESFSFYRTARTKCFNERLSHAKTVSCINLLMLLALCVCKVRTSLCNVTFCSSSNHCAERIYSFFHSLFLHGIPSIYQVSSVA